MRHGRRRNLLKPPCRNSLNPANRQPVRLTPAPCSRGTQHTLLLLKPLGVGLPPLALRPRRVRTRQPRARALGILPYPSFLRNLRDENTWLPGWVCAPAASLIPSYSQTRQVTCIASGAPPKVGKPSHARGCWESRELWAKKLDGLWHPVLGEQQRHACSPRDRAQTTSLQTLPPVWFSLQ